MTAPGIVFIDPPFEGYERLWASTNWTVYHSGAHVGMAGAMQWMFENFPDEDCYGFIADDNIPVTPGWDTELEAMAGRWHVADCNDGGYLSGNQTIRQNALCGVQCFGGDLVRAVGWWALPGVFQAGCDDAWMDLASRGGDNLRRYLDDVVVTHHNWRTGNRPQDDTDTIRRDHNEPDMAILKEWRENGDRDAAIDRMRQAMENDGT